MDRRYSDMGLLDGGRNRDLPTLTWESVLEDDGDDPGTTARPAAAPVPPPPAPAVAPAPPPAAPGSGFGEIKLEIPPLDSRPGDLGASSHDAILDPAAVRPIVAPTPLPLPTNEPGAADVHAGVSFSIPDIQEATPVAPLTFDERSALGALAQDSLAAPVPSAVPEARVAPVDPVDPVVPESSESPESPVVTAEAQPLAVPSAAVDADSLSAPAAPTIPAPPPAPPVGPTPSMPATPPTTVVPVAVLPATPAVLPPHQPAPLPYGAPAQTPHGPSATRPARAAGSGAGGRALRFLFVLVVLGALGAAAVVYGRPYLFPDAWQAEVRPYAEAVEAARGSEFVEPVTITAEAPDLYAARRSEQLFGSWQAQLPLWRSLGLANGEIDPAALDALLDGWSPALYSTVDGQVYYDSTLVEPELDAELTSAVAQAALDQSLAWSTQHPASTMDDDALVEAHVHRQAQAIQESTQFDTPLQRPDPLPLVYLPPVLGYRVVAPIMFAELLADVDPMAAVTNPLADADGPGPLAAVVPELARSPELAVGERIVLGPVAEDRSFWFLALASYLDAPQADAASRAIVENSLALIERGGRSCAVATFSGGDLAQTSTLSSALDAWAVAAPVELAATTSVLPDGAVQFTSCDPGAGFENGARFGTARELIGFRLGEIALAMATDGATKSEVEAANARYELSGIGPELAALGFDTSPADAAAAARTAVARITEPAIVTPPAGG